MARNVTPPPISDPIAQLRRERYARAKERDPQEGLVTAPWIDFLTNLIDVVGSAPRNLASSTPTDQSASIGATDISGGGLGAGLYKLSYVARIVQAATTSSSLIVTLNWTDRATSLSFSGAAMTANTVTTVQSEMLLIRIDNTSPVRYSTTYASVGATPMLYDVTVVLEAVGA